MIYIHQAVTGFYLLGALATDNTIITSFWQRRAIWNFNKFSEIFVDVVLSTSSNHEIIFRDDITL